ncbi:MAG: hypothetical protein H6567_12570 [Lewinellaceae bacterium]|nr:hypothetical protein [Lewinellaceae bacterium]
MKTEFFRNIETDSELDELISILEKNNIYYEVSSAETIVDKLIVGSGMLAKYTLKLLPKDFNATNEYIKQEALAKGIRIEDFDHLSALSDDELFEILKNPDEWSVEAEIVARKILSNRNVKIIEEDISNYKLNKTLDRKKGKSVSFIIQFLYFLCIAIGFYFGIIFLIAGIAMGYYYTYGTVTDSQGNKHYVYDEKARHNGKLILWGGIISFVIQMYLIIKIYIF